MDPTNAEIDASERTVAILKQVGLDDITVGANIFGFRTLQQPLFLLYGTSSEDKTVNLITGAPTMANTLLGIVSKDKLSGHNHDLDMVYYHHGDTRSLSITPLFRESDIIEVRFRICIILRKVI